MPRGNFDESERLIARKNSGRSAARERGGVGLGVGVVCIVFDYVKSTLAGSRQAETEDGGVKGKVG